MLGIGFRKVARRARILHSGLHENAQDRRGGGPDRIRNDFRARVDFGRGAGLGFRDRRFSLRRLRHRQRKFARRSVHDAPAQDRPYPGRARARHGVEPGALGRARQRIGERSKVLGKLRDLAVHVQHRQSRRLFGDAPARRFGESCQGARPRR